MNHANASKDSGHYTQQEDSDCIFIPCRSWNEQALTPQQGKPYNDHHPVKPVSKRRHGCDQELCSCGNSKRGAGKDDTINRNEFQELSHLFINIFRKFSQQHTQYLHKHGNGNDEDRQIENIFQPYRER